MRKVFLIARHEYIRRSRTRAFLFATVGMPLIFSGAILAIVFIMISVLQTSIGIVDHSDFIDLALIQRTDSVFSPIAEYTLYEDTGAGKSALASEKINVLVEFPDSYPSLEPLLIYTRDGSLSEDTRSEIMDFLRTQLAETLPETQKQRILEGWDFTIQSLDGTRVYTQNETITAIFVPYVIGFFFFLSIMMSSSYLLQAVAEEKENRTIEVIVTSVKPLEFIAGKSLGLLSLALTQLLIWLGALTGLLFALSRSGVLQPNLSLDGGYVSLLVLFFLPSFALAAGIMIAIGSSVTEVQQGQQMAGIVNLLFIAPWMTSALAFSNPNSPLLIGMTLFPTTSMLTIALRWSSSMIPSWQIILSLFILCFSALFSFWLSSRIFQLGMLRYGKRLTFRNITNSLRTSRSNPEEAAP
ncbi:MAG: ABC transporter permease [Anaerolineales bacterium]|nr:ABC transporter permease [Anaerolineales bacterium]